MRTASLAVLIAMTGIGLVTLANAADPRRVAPRGDANVPMENGVPVIQVVGSDESSRFVPLGIGKSVVLDLPRDIKDVLVADPTIANAVVRSARRAYLIGVKVGSRVQLDIPQALAYPNPVGGQPAGDLRFIVDVVAVS